MRNRQVVRRSLAVQPSRGRSRMAAGALSVRASASNAWVLSCSQAPGLMQIPANAILCLGPAGTALLAATAATCTNCWRSWAGKRPSSPTSPQAGTLLGCKFVQKVANLRMQCEADVLIAFLPKESRVLSDCLESSASTKRWQWPC